MSSSGYNELINKLDQFIRKYYKSKLIRGSLYFIGLVLLLFLSFASLEHFFYFGTGVRKAMFFLFLAVSLVSFSIWIGYPLLQMMRLGKVISHEQAATIIGNHFPNVQDKLLNILQLKQQAGSEANALVLAGIDQKSNEIKPVPFTNAVNLGENRKYFKYAIAPLLLLIILLFAAPSMIKDSADRIIKNNQAFERQAPFEFIVQNNNLNVIQNEDFTLRVDVEGQSLPKDVYIEVNNFRYRMKINDDNGFSYTFKNLQNNTPFKLYAAGFYSTPYELKMINKPIVDHIEVILNYPAYTGLKSTSLENLGDFTVPVGTRVEWRVSTRHTQAVDFVFDRDNEDEENTKPADQSGSQLFVFKDRVLRGGNYTMLLSNPVIDKPDSLQYSIRIIEDEFPTIEVEQFIDSNSVEKVFYFAGEAQDDYGIRFINFYYDHIDANGSMKKQDTISIADAGGKKQVFSYIWDLEPLQLKAGERLNYYFEVGDNDAIRGSKKTRSQMMTFAKPSREEFKEMATKNNEDIKATLDKNIKELRDIQKELQEIREKLLQDKDMNWQRQKELERLLERKKDLEKAIDEARKKFQENLQNQNEMEEKPSEQLQDKQDKLDELFDKMVDPEKQELLDKIKELQQQMKKEDALDMMEKMNNQSRQEEMEMDRLMELFKNLEVEFEAEQTARELEQMAQEQDAIRDEMKDENADKEDLQQKQEELNEKMEDLLKKMEDLEKKNQELQRPKDFGDSKGKMEDAEQEMKEAGEKMKQNDDKSAQKNQKKASEKMRDAAQEMQGAMQSGEMMQMEEDMAALRQLLENILTLSFDQEDLIKDFESVNTVDPAYVRLIQEQNRIKDNFKIVEDSLVALSKRVFQLESIITEKIHKIETNIQYSIDELEERKKQNAADHQQRTMTHLNDLALMLNEAMEQMQNAMSQMMPGDQMCQNPGQNPGSEGEGDGDGNKPVDKITEGQEGVSEDMKKLSEKMKQGEGGSAKEFAEIAAKQAQLRKALEALQKQGQERGAGSQELQEIIDQMNQNEIDLVNKKLTNQMLKRQQDILSRLLEAEKASREQDWDDKRKAERPEIVDRKMPPSMEEYIRQREAETEMFKSVPPTLRPYYKNLAESYYNLLRD